VGDDSLISAQAKLAYLVVIMGNSSGLKSAQKKGLLSAKQTAMHQQLT
jgi:hypothetical protein